MEKEKKTPISEKVKFWEEQDKINQAVIPRIIEINEALKNLRILVSQFDNKITATESRLKKDIKKKDSITGFNKFLPWIAIFLSIGAITLSILLKVVF